MRDIEPVTPGKLAVPTLAIVIMLIAGPAETYWAVALKEVRAVDPEGPVAPIAPLKVIVPPEPAVVTINDLV